MENGIVVCTVEAPINPRLPLRFDELQGQTFENNNVQYQYPDDDYEEASDKKLKRKSSLDDSPIRKKNKEQPINDSDVSEATLEYAISTDGYSNPATNLVITSNTKIPQQSSLRIEFVNQDQQPDQQKSAVQNLKDITLNKEQLVKLNSIYHAFHCQKLHKKSCPEAYCKDPQEIVEAVTFNLSQNYEVPKGNISREYISHEYIAETYTLMLFHTAQCKDQSNCQMPLCKGFGKSSVKVSQSDEHDKEYSIYNTKDEKLTKEKIIEGEDFKIVNEVNIDKGQFGRVSLCAVKNIEGETFSTVLKRIQLDQPISQALSNSLPALKNLQNHRNILVPDLVVYSKREACVFMPKADLSLFQYLKTYEGGMPVDAVTFYIFQLAKALKKIHNCGYTHGDIKVSNCLLFRQGRLLKLADLDTLKPIHSKMMSGSKHYVDPRVLINGNVDKASDVFSLCQCIAVLLFGGKDIIASSSSAQIHEQIREKDIDLAEIYKYGTMVQPGDRITAKQVVAWVCANVTLKGRCDNFQPKPISKCILPGKDLCDHVLEGYFTASTRNLSSKFNLVL